MYLTDAIVLFGKNKCETGCNYAVSQQQVLTDLNILLKHVSCHHFCLYNEDFLNPAATLISQKLGGVQFTHNNWNNLNNQILYV